MADPALIPGPYWHTKGLEFTSWQGVLPKGEEGEGRQQQQEQPRPPSDELITLYMSTPNELSGFIEQRSVLALSPTFAEFFSSPYFTPGMATCIWLGREHPLVVKIALYYLLLHNPTPRPSSSSAASSADSSAASSSNSSSTAPSSLSGGNLAAEHDDGDFHTPSLAHYNPSDHVYLQIRLYFLAKRLQLTRLEDIAYGMLRAGEHRIGAKEVVDLAEVIYDKDEEEDPRIRLFLNRCVEMNLRALLHLPSWRTLLCEARPSLAANMFDLLSTLILSGSAPTYPLPLPSPTPFPYCNAPSFSPLGTRILAIALRHFQSDSPGDLNISRGETLRDCWIGAQWVVGTNQKGARGYFPRDWVEFVWEDQREGSEGGEEGGGGVGRKAGSLLGLVPSRGGTVSSGGKKKGRLAALQRKWKSVSRESF